ncbi:MAG TPA: hypothetical protein VF175_13905 [Lacipirellula sp.]
MRHALIGPAFTPGLAKARDDGRAFGVDSAGVWPRPKQTADDFGLGSAPAAIIINRSAESGRRDASPA